MSINDELKVVWKTKCRWRDQGHLAKRKDLKPKGVNAKVDFAMLPLKPGDDVRIRFGKQWYDGDMVVYIILTNLLSFKDHIPTRLRSHDLRGRHGKVFQRAFRFQISSLQISNIFWGENSTLYTANTLQYIFAPRRLIYSVAA